MAGLPAERFIAAPKRLWTTANIEEASDELYEKGWNLDFDYRPEFRDLWGVK